MILRARVVLPMGSTPIEDGAVVIHNGTIALATGWDNLRVSKSSADVVDLGDAVLLPGLINGHCHLEYTQMAGTVGFEGSFTGWLKSMVAQKQTASMDFFQQSSLLGARKSAACGTTTVLDNISRQDYLPFLCMQSPVRIIPLLELIDVHRTPEEALTPALAFLDKISADAPARGLSPHTPYTASALLFSRALAEASSRGLRIGCHVAESQEEWECFTNHSGPLFDWLAPLTRIMDHERATPVQYLERHHLLAPGMIMTHANYLDHGDIKLLARRNIQVCHCPGSHAFFQHAPFEAEKLRQFGIPLCLGTDSLASSPVVTGQDLSLFAEMRLFRDRHPSFSALEILKMTTLGGAAAAGISHCTGQLSTGYWADIIAIPYSGPLHGVYNAVIEHEGPVSMSMVNGRFIHGGIPA